MTKLLVDRLATILSRMRVLVPLCGLLLGVGVAALADDSSPKERLATSTLDVQFVVKRFVDLISAARELDLCNRVLIEKHFSDVPNTKYHDLKLSQFIFDGVLGFVVVTFADGGGSAPSKCGVLLRHPDAMTDPFSQLRPRVTIADVMQQIKLCPIRGNPPLRHGVVLAEYWWCDAAIDAETIISFEFIDGTLTRVALFKG